MTLKIKCPGCTAAFALAEDVRGAQVFCPMCGKSLMVSSAGIAKEYQGRVPAQSAPARSVKLFWFLCAVPLLLLIGGLTAKLITRYPIDQHQETAKAVDDQVPPPTPLGKAPATDSPGIEKLETPKLAQKLSDESTACPALPSPVTPRGRDR